MGLNTVGAGQDFLACIRRNYKGREKEAIAYLWKLYNESSPEVQFAAYHTLKAVETNVEFDLLIARAQRGVTNG